ncbi:AbrB family transcriptional regulator [Tsukamurella serpentis]
MRRLGKLSPRLAAQWIVCLGIAIGAGFALDSRIGWLFAGIAGAGLVSLYTGRSMSPPKVMLRPAQGIMAMSSGVIVISAGLGAIPTSIAVALPPVLLTVVVSLLGGLAVRWVHRSTAVPTALISALPGGATATTTMSSELRGVDHSYIALAQYVRLLLVVFTLPGILLLLQQGEVDDGGGGLPTRMFNTWQETILIVIILATGVAGRIGSPELYFLTPFVTSIVVGAATGTVPMPGDVISTFAYLVIGLQAGGILKRQQVLGFLKTAPTTIAVTFGIIGMCVGIAFLISYLTSISVADAYLGTSPGGIYASVAAINATGADPAAAIMQVLRVYVCIGVFLLIVRLAKLTPDRKKVPAE